MKDFFKGNKIKVLAVMALAAAAGFYIFNARAGAFWDDSDFVEVRRGIEDAIEDARTGRMPDGRVSDRKIKGVRVVIAKGHKDGTTVPRDPDNPHCSEKKVKKGWLRIMINSAKRHVNLLIKLGADGSVRHQLQDWIAYATSHDSDVGLKIYHTKLSPNGDGLNERISDLLNRSVRSQECKQRSERATEEAEKDQTQDQHTWARDPENLAQNRYFAKGEIHSAHGVTCTGGSASGDATTGDQTTGWCLKADIIDAVEDIICGIALENSKPPYAPTGTMQKCVKDAREHGNYDAYMYDECRYSGLNNHRPCVQHEGEDHGHYLERKDKTWCKPFVIASTQGAITSCGLEDNNWMVLPGGVKVPVFRGVTGEEQLTETAIEFYERWDDWWDKEGCNLLALKDTSNLLDRKCPTRPKSLVANANGVDDKISLSWGPSKDDRGPVEYKVYRNGEEIGKTKSTKFETTGTLSSSFHVVAIDGAGRHSAYSDVVFPQDGLAASVIVPTKQLLQKLGF